MKKAFLLIIVLLLLTVGGCINSDLPIYEKTDEDGMSVIIDGVRYKQLPLLKWQVSSTFFTSSWEAQVIGYAGERDIKLVEVYGDTERNFINVRINGHYDGFLYRTDIIFPEPSAESVDELSWDDYIGGSDEIYSNTTVDRSIIKELFEILGTGEKTAEFEMIKKNDETFIVFINCMSSDLPGAYYRLSIGKSNGKIVCGNMTDKYVEIPIELLEDIAGHGLYIEEFLKDSQE